jgi:hypothetical protein
MKRMGHYPEMGKGNQQQSSMRRLRGQLSPKSKPEVLPAAELPQMGKAWDYIYPRCVWCRGENYVLSVLAYSRGEIPCASVGGCGRFLPEDYRRPADE